MFYNLFVLFIKPKYPSLFGTWWVSSLFCSMCMKCKYILICEKKKKKTDSSTLPPCWSNRSSTLAWKETEYCQCLHGNGKFKLALITKILIERILLFPD